MGKLDSSQRELLFHLALINEGYTPDEIRQELVDLSSRITTTHLEEICKEHLDTTRVELHISDVKKMLPNPERIIGQISGLPPFRTLNFAELDYFKLFDIENSTAYKIPPVVYMFGNVNSILHNAKYQNIVGVWSKDKGESEKDPKRESEASDRLTEFVFNTKQFTAGGIDNEHGRSAFHLSKKKGAVGVTNYNIPNRYSGLPNIPEKSAIVSLLPPHLKLLGKLPVDQYKSMKYSTRSTVSRISSRLINPRKDPSNF